jgi:hypothetical protein
VWDRSAGKVPEAPEGVKVAVEPREGGTGAGTAALRIENTGSTRRAVTVLVLERPALEGRRYAVVGRVRYEGVEGDAFLQMWSHFPGGGRYFTRTLAPSGPMAKLTGSSGWRRFVMPFDASQAPATPSRIAVELVLPGPGTVWLGPLTLGGLAGAGAKRQQGHARRGRRGAGTAGGTAAGGAWWSGGSGGLVGAVGGVGIAVIALVLYWLGLRGRRLRLLRWALPVVLLAAVAVLGAGFVALGRGQPYAVYYPLLLVGGLLVLLCLLFGLMARRLSAQLELRRMRALDS